MLEQTGIAVRSHRQTAKENRRSRARRCCSRAGVQKAQANSLSGENVPGEGEGVAGRW